MIDDKLKQEILAHAEQCKPQESCGFVVFDGQREGFVEPFFLYGKVADGQFGIGVAAEIVHQAADNGRVFGFDFLVEL